MSFDGNGNYTVPPGTAAVTGTAIDSAKYNAFLIDLQTALSKALLRDGQSAAQANIPMGSKKLTGLAAGSVAGDSVRFEQLFAQTHLRAFGAVGDGVTNDAAAIQAAHDSLPAVGGTIMVGKGSFLHSTALTFTKRVRLIGEGVAITNAQSPSEFRKGSGIAGDGFILSGSGTTVEGVAFRGVTGNTGDGVVVKAGRITFRDCAFYAMGNDGLRIGTDAGGENCNLWMLDNCKAKSNGRHGVFISEGSTAPVDASGGTCLHLDAQVNGADGLAFGYSNLNTIIGGAYQQNANYGLRFSANSSYNALYGGDYETNTLAQIRLDAGSVGNLISSYTLNFSAASIATITDPNTFHFGDRVQVPVGITFPATAVASADANTLDDYQETDIGSTIAVAGTSSAGSATYTSRVADVTKIGNRVFVTAILAWSAHTGTGNLKVTGLPYAAKAGVGRTVFSIGADNLTYAGELVGYLENGATEFTIGGQATGAALSSIAMDTAATLYINFSYLSA